MTGASPRFGWQRSRRNGVLKPETAIGRNRIDGSFLVSKDVRLPVWKVERSAANGGPRAMKMRTIPSL